MQKGSSICVTNYILQITKARAHKNEDEDEQEENAECLEMCCHGGVSETTKKGKKKILINLAEELEGRGNV